MTGFGDPVFGPGEPKASPGPRGQRPAKTRAYTDGGPRRGAGRPKGSLNKVSSTFRDVLLQAVSEVGDSREEGVDGQGGLLGYLKKAAIRELSFQGWEFARNHLMLHVRLIPQLGKKRWEINATWQPCWPLCRQGPSRCRRFSPMRACIRWPRSASSRLLLHFLFVSGCWKVWRHPLPATPESKKRYNNYGGCFFEMTAVPAGKLLKRGAEADTAKSPTAIKRGAR
jgi:hypothetical protein